MTLAEAIAVIREQRDNVASWGPNQIHDNDKYGRLKELDRVLHLLKQVEASKDTT